MSCRHCAPPVEKFTVKGLTVRIEHDEDPADPRENDNLGVMVCFHGRYTLGDTDHGFRSDDYSSWEEVEAAIRKEKGAVIVLPLYLYDHSGLHIKVGSFQGMLPQGHAEFDSGQIGFIYASKAQIRECYMVKRLTRKVLAQAEKSLRGEVEEYADFLAGRAYGYVIEDAEGEQLDSCWGFIGDLDDVRSEARSAAEHEAEVKGKRG